MGTLVTLRYSKDLPSTLAKSLRPQCAISGSALSILDAERAPLATIAELVAPFNNSIVFGPYFVPENDYDLSSPDVVAAVLGPGEVQGSANSPADFSPELPPPCFGLVREGIALECRAKPKGRIEMIGDNLIISKQMLRLLVDEKSGEITHRVHLKGKPLDSWTGYRFVNNCEVIGALSFAPPTYCALCKTPYTPWRGVWIANLEECINCRICTDVRGYGHGQSRRPIIVSKELAADIRSSLGGNGYNLEPIHRGTSEYGRLISSICDIFRNPHATEVGPKIGQTDKV